MKQRLRQNSPVLVLLVFLVALTSITTYQQLRNENAYPALSVLSNEPDGARALLLWLDTLDYEVSTETLAVFDVPEESDLLLILEPQLPGVSADEWLALERWVESGGVLFLVGEGFGSALSMEQYEFEIAYRDDLTGDVEYLDRSLGPAEEELLANLRPRATLQSARSDIVPLVSIDGEHLAASLSLGKGHIVFSTLAYPFSNEGLKQPGNASFAIRMLALAPQGSSIWFDEWHHGLRTSQSSAPEGIGQWIRASRPGQAIMYTVVVLFLWLLASGARFGRPLPLTQNRQRKASAEHVTALANLSRQAGHRYVVREHFRRTLKQSLGRRYGLPPVLADDEFIERLEAAQPGVDGRKLSAVLEELAQKDISEDRMLKLAQEISTWTTS